MPPTVWFRKGKKDHWEKFPITLNDVIDIYRQRSSGLQNKSNSVSVQVQTAHFGNGENSKQAGTSFEKKTGQKLECIENNPLSIILTFLTIYWEVLTSMIDVGPITPWERSRNLTTPSLKPAGKLSSSYKRISMIRSASQMKTTKKTRPRKIKTTSGSWRNKVTQ